jgi:hypothetical protein
VLREVGVLEEVGGEGEEACEGLFFGLVGVPGHELEAEELVGVGEVVCGEEYRGFLPWSGKCQLAVGRAGVASTHNSANIFFAVSAS